MSKFKPKLWPWHLTFWLKHQKGSSSSCEQHVIIAGLNKIQLEYRTNFVHKWMDEQKGGILDGRYTDMVKPDNPILQHVVVKHGCPRRQNTCSQNLEKFLSPTFLSPPYPKGNVISVKCELSLDEFIVQFWLLYDHPNFKNRCLWNTNAPFPNISRIGLTFDHDLSSTDKNIDRGNLLIKDYLNLQSLKLLGLSVLELSVTQGEGHQHDLWPTDLNIHRYHQGLLVSTYQVWSFCGKALELTYQMHKVCEANMTFDLDFRPTNLILKGVI